MLPCVYIERKDIISLSADFGGNICNLRQHVNNIIYDQNVYFATQKCPLVIWVIRSKVQITLGNMSYTEASES